MTTEEPRTPPENQHPEGLREYMRIREVLSKNQWDRLVSSIVIAAERARTARAPQEVTIRFTDKGYPRYIDPTDNHGPVE